MQRVSYYLNFAGKTEEAFTFYREVFGTEFESFQRMKEVPQDPGTTPLSRSEAELVMHVALPIHGGAMLMGTDSLESMGHTLTMGNNISLNLETDDLRQATALFDALSADAINVTPLQPMFWGAHWGSLCDKFGVHWMVNCAPAASQA